MNDREFWSGCPEVQIDPEKLNGEPTVGPYRVAARTVVECEELGDSPEDIAKDYRLPVDRVKAILDYHHSRQPELTPSR